MKLTKNHLKQLIQEMMEAEEMEAEVEETEGLDFDNLPDGVYEFPSNYWIVGPERERAKEEDPGMKELEDHVMEGGEGLILGKSNGRINVLVVFRDINPFTGLDRGVGWGREGHGGGTRGGLDLSPEDALKYLKRGAELIPDQEIKDVFMNVTEKDLENMPDDTYFVAKTDKKGPKEERPKTSSRGGRGPSRRRDINYDEPYGGDVVARRAAAQAKKYGTGRRRFEEGKLTKSKLFQIIKEEISSMIQEDEQADLHDKAVKIDSFWRNVKRHFAPMCQEEDPLYASPVDSKLVAKFYALLDAHPVTKAMATYDLPKLAFYKDYFSKFTPASQSADPDDVADKIKKVAQGEGGRRKRKIAKPGAGRRVTPRKYRRKRK